MQYSLITFVAICKLTKIYVMLGCHTLERCIQSVDCRLSVAEFLE